MLRKTHHLAKKKIQNSLEFFLLPSSRSIKDHREPSRVSQKKDRLDLILSLLKVFLVIFQLFYLNVSVRMILVLKKREGRRPTILFYFSSQG